MSFLLLGVSNITTLPYPTFNYCPQTTPDYAITYNLIPQFTLVNYCPQTTPDYDITYNVIPQFTLVNYCPQTTPDYSFLIPP